MGSLLHFQKPNISPRAVASSPSQQRQVHIVHGRWSGRDGVGRGGVHFRLRGKPGERRWHVGVGGDVDVVEAGKLSRGLAFLEEQRNT